MAIKQYVRRAVHRAAYLSWLRPSIIILILIISNPFNALAWSEETVNKPNCDKPKIALLLADLQVFRKEYGSAIEIGDATNTVVNEIARRYVSTDCDLAEVMINLADAGFSFSTTNRYDPNYGFKDFRLKEIKNPYFFASINLNTGWSDLFSPIFELQIVHESGRIKSVNAVFIYIMP